MRERITMETVDFSTKSRGRRETLVVGFTVAFEDRSPGTAVRIVNDLVTSILQEDVKSRTERASDTTQFLQRETDRRREELAKLKSRISTFKLENDAALPEKQPYQLGRLDNARAQLLNLGSEMQSNIEQQRLLQLELSVRKAGGEVGLTSQSSISSPSRELQLLKADLAKKQSVYKDSHPDIVALKQQISTLESTIGSASNTDTANDENTAPSIDLPVRLLEAKIAALTERHKKLQLQREDVARSVKSINALILRIPEVQGALSNLERRREIAQKGVEELTQKLNDARLGERLERDRQAERFQVIEQPIAPTDPVRPNRPLILAGGIAAALGAAFGITLLLEMLNRSVRTANDIARAISQMPLGVIPYLETAQERRRHKSRIIYVVIALLALGVASFAAIHWFYLPLDELSFKVLRRFGLL